MKTALLLLIVLLASFADESLGSDHVPRPGTTAKPATTIAGVTDSQPHVGLLGLEESQVLRQVQANNGNPALKQEGKQELKKENS